MSESRSGLTSPGAVRPHPPLGVIVALCCLAQFMVVLDGTIVTIALADMRADLGMSISQQQWVVSGYLVALGGLLLLAARIGDLYGRKRVFLVGSAVFTVASLVGGLATDPIMLIVARIVQGAGAAALIPTSLSLITASHTDEQQRDRAVSLWSLMGALSSVVGVVLGGLLTEISWRWVMFVNVPPGLLLLVVGALKLVPDGVGAARTRLDLPGALTVTFGIGALTYGLSQAEVDGWAAANVVIALVAAAVLLVAFVLIEVKSSHPLIPLAIFRPRTVVIGNLIVFAMGVTMTAVAVFLSLYFQEALGYDAWSTGLALVPMAAIVIVGGLGARQMLPSVGTRPLMILGGLITTAGLGWMTGLPAHPAYLTHVLGPILVVGVGLSFMLPAASIVSTTGVAPENDGAAAGVLNTSRQIGGAVGLAVLVTVAASATGDADAGSTPTEAAVEGFQMAFLVNAGVMLVVTLVAFLLPKTQTATTPE